MSDERIEALVRECRRQEESCLYTSSGLYQWQKNARVWRNIFVVAPIILGGIASSQILAGSEAQWASIMAAILALLAGFFPAIYEALGMNMRVTEIGQSAAEFTNLRDRFRQTANITAHTSYEELAAAFEQLMDRLDAARKISPPLPEKYFKQAQVKVDRGDYDFGIDSGARS